MSTWFDETITCPTCACEQTARLARGVHVARAPEARDQVFDRTFHRVTCRSCGGRFVAKRPLLYTDMDRKHWVHVAMAHQRPRWPELEASVREVFEAAFVGSPLAAELRNGFRFRVVFGIEELREKLVIWREGYDDSLAECVKLRAIERDPDLSSAHHILLESIADTTITLATFDSSDRPERRVELPRAVLDEQRSDEERLRRYLPDLFGSGFVSIHRLLGPHYRPPMAT